MVIWQLKIKKKNSVQMRKRPVQFAEGCYTRPDHPAELLAVDRRALNAVKTLGELSDE